MPQMGQGQETAQAPPSLPLSPRTDPVLEARREAWQGHTISPRSLSGSGAQLQPGLLPSSRKQLGPGAHIWQSIPEPSADSEGEWAAEGEAGRREEGGAESGKGER